MPTQILKNIEYSLCDIDGTLTGINGRGHSPKLLDTIQRLISNGIKIGLVSGRETLTAIAVHRIFDLNGRPTISENGAVLILEPHENERGMIHLGGLSQAQFDAVKQRLAGRGLLDRLFIGGEKNHLLTLYPNEFPHHRPDDLPALCRQVIDALQSLSVDVEISYSSAAISVNDLSAFEVVGCGGGWVALVRDEPAVKLRLQAYPRVYYAHEYASKGTVEFLEFFSRHRNVL
ncbi:MAG TPA: HAD hydrolase family protein [bacterium]